MYIFNFFFFIVTRLTRINIIYFVGIGNLKAKSEDKNPSLVEL